MSKNSPTSTRRRRSPASRFLAAATAILVMSTTLIFVETAVQPEEAEARPYSMPIGAGSVYRDDGCKTSTTYVTRTDEEGNPYQVPITRYVCEWVQKETRSGMAYWTKRPEFMDFQYIPDAVRENPIFADDLAEDMYHSWKANGDGQADPSTVSDLHWYTYQPCKYKSLNGDALLQVQNGLLFDKVDWAKQVTYQMDVFTKWYAAYDVDGETGAETVVTSPFQEVMRRQKGDNPFTFIRWTGCQSAGLGSEVGVQVSCPVYAQPVVVDGPYGNGLPSRSGISAFAEQTKRRIIRVEGPLSTPFGANDWDRLKSPKTSAGAPAAIATVKACRDESQVVDLDLVLPSPGNYDFDVTMWYVECSYSIFPGFTNGYFFGGCQKEATSSRLLEYTSNAKCDGKLRRGVAAADYNFDPASCYVPMCEWSGADDVQQNVVIDNAPDTPSDQTPLDSPIVAPKDARIYANGKPLEWSVGLTRMEVEKRSALTASPTPIGNSRYTVFDVAEESTPWNPMLEVEEVNVNSPKQYFSSESAGVDGALSMVPSLVDPKNGLRRIPNWTSLRFFVYSGSEVAKPMKVTISKMQSWRLPTLVPVVGATGEFGTVGSDPGEVIINQVLRCSSNQARVYFVGTRLTPTAPRSSTD